MKKIKILLSVLSCVLTGFAWSQAIVTLDPPFPTGSDLVTLTYHADQGNGQLADLTPGTNVYAHTGITVNGSTWQYVVGDWGNC
ncbi:MAG: hypothetical protein R2850_05290 [Bacteroidia bacterium]